MGGGRLCEACGGPVSEDRERPICVACEVRLAWPPRALRLMAALGVLSAVVALGLLGLRWLAG